MGKHGAKFLRQGWTFAHRPEELECNEVWLICVYVSWQNCLKAEGYKTQ